MVSGIRWVLTALLAVLVMAACPAEALSEDTVIPVVASSLHPAYQEALRGIEEGLSRAGYRIEVIDLGGAAEPEEVKEKLTGSDPGLVVTVGTLATETVRKAMPGVPIVFSMVLRFDPASHDGKSTGVVIEIPAGERLKWFKRLVPTIRRVGIIYSARSEAVVEEARMAAAGLGLEMVPLRIGTPAQLPQAQERLVAEADSLLAVPDGMIYNSVLTPHIILFTLRHKIPFMGLSRNFTRSGALLSLDCDYHDVGLQTAEMAVMVARGTAPSDIPVAGPRRIYPVVNDRIAQILGVKVRSKLAGVEE